MPWASSLSTKASVRPLLSLASTTKVRLANLPLEKTIQNFDGKNFSEFKEKMSEVLIEKIEPISNEIRKLIHDKTYLDKILSEGHQKANDIASLKIKKLQEIVGF